MTPRVSVVIVNFKAYNELLDCLRSLEATRNPGVQIHVIDHSTESAKIEAITQSFPWADIDRRNDNPGFAAGVNRAAQRASGKYLLMLNPDCVLAGDAIETMATWMDSHPRVGVCGALVRNADGSVQASARRFPDVTTAFGGRTTWLTRMWPSNPMTRRNLRGHDATEPMEVDWVSGACTMVRRVAFDEVGGMDEGFFLYWEDADLCFRLKERGWTTFYHPGAVATHLAGRSSAHAKRQSVVAFHRSAYRYFSKNASGLARFASPLVYLALQLRLAGKLARLK